jgi:hypothetical protein
LARAAAVEEIPGGPQPIPASLPIPGEDGIVAFSGSTATIPVILEPTDPIVAHWTDFHRPAEGGDSIGNARVGGAGTLGAAVTVSTHPGKLFLITNWHVLNGGSGSNGDAVFQQSAYDGGLAPAAWIGTLFWSSLTSRVDLALAEVRGAGTVALGKTRGHGQIAGLRNPAAGSAVKKSGRTTNANSGTVVSVNTTVQVGGYPGGARTFQNQIMTTDMSRPGDSGSVLLDAQNYMVGLIFAGNSSTQSFANRADEVNNALRASFAADKDLRIDFVDTPS